MATSIAKIRVTKTEANNGFIATCDHPRCRWRITRATRLLADVAGHAHQRTHVIPDPTDQVSDF